MPRRATRSLLFALVVTDALFIAYWIVAALAEVNVVSLPPSLMYAGYGDDRVCAWNWSFFPLDVAFSVTGLLTRRAGRGERSLGGGRRRSSRWRCPVAGLAASRKVPVHGVGSRVGALAPVCAA